MSRFQSICPQNRDKKKISRYYHVHNWVTHLVKTDSAVVLAALLAETSAQR